MTFVWFTEPNLLILNPGNEIWPEAKLTVILELFLVHPYDDPLGPVDDRLGVLVGLLSAFLFSLKG